MSQEFPDFLLSQYPEYTFSSSPVLKADSSNVFHITLIHWKLPHGRKGFLLPKKVAPGRSVIALQRGLPDRISVLLSLSCARNELLSDYPQCRRTSSTNEYVMIC